MLNNGIHGKAGTLITIIWFCFGMKMTYIKCKFSSGLRLSWNAISKNEKQNCCWNKDHQLSSIIQLNFIHNESLYNTDKNWNIITNQIINIILTKDGRGRWDNWVGSFGWDCRFFWWTEVFFETSTTIIGIDCFIISCWSLWKVSRIIISYNL